MNCETGYYLDGTTASSCKACSTGCEQCYSLSYCGQCKSDYTLSSSGECTIKTQTKTTTSSSSSFGIGGIIGAVVGSVIFIVIIVVIICACKRKNMRGTQMTSGQPNSTGTVPGGPITMGAVLPMAPAPGYMAKSASVVESFYVNVRARFFIISKQITGVWLQCPCRALICRLV